MIPAAQDQEREELERAERSEQRLEACRLVAQLPEHHEGGRSVDLYRVEHGRDRAARRRPGIVAGEAGLDELRLSRSRVGGARAGGG